MEEKEKSCHIDEWANYFLAALSSSPEERLKVLQKAFLLAAEKEDDETAKKLLDFICKGYSDMEIAVALKTDQDYRMAGFRADAKCCDIFRSVYWQLPQNRLAWIILPKTKLEIIRLWMVRWRNYDCNPYIKDDKKAVDAFNFLISIYNDENGGENILQLFRKYTNYNLTPEIAEKWLAQPNVPEEIRKIFRIAWIRNGGQELFDRCMKNAEIVKSLEKISALSILSAENK